MTGKERASPIFRPWAQQQSEARIVQPEPVYLLPPPAVSALQPAFPSQLTAWEVAQHHHAPVLLQQELAARWKAKKQRPKRFQCPHCKVSFSNNGQLKGHVRIHTGERPFACEHEGCGKTFTRNEELTRHRRIHTGLRPFPCPLCQKPFGRKDHLKKHVKTHERALLPGLPYFFGATPDFFFM
ncbi:Krueppel-like factor 1 [Amblyomma americanum]